jgi:DNA-binding response OmpR family regulator
MLARKTILIVDDDPTILNMLATALEGRYDVLRAEGGVAKLYLVYRRLPLRSEIPDVRR